MERQFGVRNSSHSFGTMALEFRGRAGEDSKAAVRFNSARLASYPRPRAPRWF